MMIDSSAVLAILFAEAEAQKMATAIAGAATRRMSAVNWLEFLIVVESRYDPESADSALLFLQDLNVETVSFDREQLLEARAAWQRFGKGNHPAALNMGDCCAYAAATVTGEPLLCKGADFSKTDLPLVDWR